MPRATGQECRVVSLGLVVPATVFLLLAAGRRRWSKQQHAVHIYSQCLQKFLKEPLPDAEIPRIQYNVMCHIVPEGVRFETEAAAKKEQFEKSTESWEKRRADQVKKQALMMVSNGGGADAKPWIPPAMPPPPAPPIIRRRPPGRGLVKDTDKSEALNFTKRGSSIVVAAAKYNATMVRRRRGAKGSNQEKGAKAKKKGAKGSAKKSSAPRSKSAKARKEAKASKDEGGDNKKAAGKDNKKATDTKVAGKGEGGGNKTAKAASFMQESVRSRGSDQGRPWPASEQLNVDTDHFHYLLSDDEDVTEHQSSVLEAVAAKNPTKPGRELHGQDSAWKHGAGKSKDGADLRADQKAAMTISQEDPEAALGIKKEKPVAGMKPAGNKTAKAAGGKKGAGVTKKHKKHKKWKSHHHEHVATQAMTEKSLLKKARKIQATLDALAEIARLEGRPLRKTGQHVMDHFICSNWKRVVDSIDGTQIILRGGGRERLVSVRQIVHHLIQQNRQS